MAKITLDNLRHSYMATPQTDIDWALKKVDIDWSDGGAYALLGPSGCGKTSLLNIISGLLKPTEGKVIFDGKDVTGLQPDERHIAQVFQFPVVYDTMTVYDNLAFPLRNRQIAEAQVDQRVRSIAEMLDLTATLDKRASGLTADGKQKISLGRGLVREDVNAILFDEPLTVIDPHLKWQLRSKLKELHQRVRATMIYVTHDQTEALTFADQVVVMKDGEIVQIGTPVDLFERPQHTFVGHFIGSPGMNVLACSADNGQIRIGSHPIDTANGQACSGKNGSLEIGIRPEFVEFSDTGVPVTITKVTDVGRFKIVSTTFEDRSIKLLVTEGQPVPSDNAHLAFRKEQTRVYENGWVVPGEVGVAELGVGEQGR